MIQGATLDAIFCDALEANCKISASALIAGYIGFSRVKQRNRVYILQPFSPHLFKQGPPAGPDILLRKLLGEISPKKAVEEWDAAQETAAPASKDAMSAKIVCTMCYKQG